MKMLAAWLMAAVAAAAGGGTLACIGWVLINFTTRPSSISIGQVIGGLLLLAPLLSLLIGFVPAIVAMALFGMPAHIILTNARTTRPRDYARAGLVVGFICAVPPGAVASISHDDGIGMFLWVATGATLVGGPLGGYVFGALLSGPRRSQTRATAANPAADHSA